MTHAYSKDGKPRHYVDDGKGVTRDTTLRDMRKNDWLPSVTDILGVADKPGLNRYFQNQILEAGYYTDVPGRNYDEWCKEVRQKADEHSAKARDAGIAVHNSLERAFLGKEVTDEHLEAVDAVSSALYEKYGELEKAKTEVTFAYNSEGYGYGGTIDLVLPDVIIDYKRKADGWEKKKNGDPKKIWYVESHAAQLAAYRAGTGMHDAKCANVFISPDNEVWIHEWSDEDLAQGLSIFMASLNLWKTLKKF